MDSCNDCNTSKLECIRAGDPAGKSLESKENGQVDGHAKAEGVNTLNAVEAAAKQGSDLSTKMTSDSQSGASLRSGSEVNAKTKEDDDEDVVILSPISPFKANRQKSKQTPKKERTSNAGKAASTPSLENK